MMPKLDDGLCQYLMTVLLNLNLSLVKDLMSLKCNDLFYLLFVLILYEQAHVILVLTIFESSKC